MGNVVLRLSKLPESRTSPKMRANVKILIGRPLPAAAARGQHQTVKLLLENGADDSNRHHPFNGIYRRHDSFPALRAAIKGGHDATVELLLTPKYDLRCGLPEAEWALLDAVEYCAFDTVLLLMETFQ